MQGLIVWAELAFVAWAVLAVLWSILTGGQSK
jgi:hypothetical protein